VNKQRLSSRFGRACICISCVLSIQVDVEYSSCRTKARNSTGETQPSRTRPWTWARLELSSFGVTDPRTRSASVSVRAPAAIDHRHKGAPLTTTLNCIILQIPLRLAFTILLLLTAGLYPRLRRHVRFLSHTSSSSSHPTFPISLSPSVLTSSAWSRSIPVETSWFSSKSDHALAHSIQTLHASHYNLEQPAFDHECTEYRYRLSSQHYIPEWRQLVWDMGPRAKRKPARKSGVSQDASDYDIADSSPSRSANKRRKVRSSSSHPACSDRLTCCRSMAKLLLAAKPHPPKSMSKMAMRPMMKANSSHIPT
jgi:hypothetical protein